MKIMGIDPSSTICGVALVEDERLLATWTWKKDKTRSGVWNLADYFKWIDRLISTQGPHMVCVEFLSVERNAQTTRKVSHFQAASALAAKLRGKMTIEGRVSSARKEALGDGSMSKDAAWVAVRERFPDHDFQRADLGGYDEADATVLALAATGIAEGK